MDRNNYDDAEAVLMHSEQLGCDIWFAFKDGWTPGDKLAVYYASELRVLARKSQIELAKIQRAKLAMPGSIIRR